MGAEPPFLYDGPSNRSSQITYPYSDFNPRAATQAHYVALAERAERQKLKAQQAGKPLINFNQHPDSYMIVSNPATDFEPMPPNSKKVIVWSRWVQLVFRVLQEVAALGVLVCVICLKMDNDGPGWIIRVAPAWDSVISLYAIYHLLRPAKGRTPSSSASYHFFALFMDAGLTPFYVFIALYANQNYNEQVGVDGRWTSFFSTNFATTTVIFATFIGSIVLGALHLVSIGLDLLLIIKFRKIAQLPPDMNPLEDNLTGSTRRRSQKHTYKNSEVSVASSSADTLAEKKSGYLSGSTLSGNDSRLSVAKEPTARTMPFGHSRMDSNNTYSPHNPDSARLSRQQYDDISLYQGPHSARSSHVDVPNGRRSRAGSVVNPTKHTSVVDFGEIPEVPTFSDTKLPYTAKSGSFATTHIDTPGGVLASQSNTLVKSQQKQGLLNDNWYVLDDDAASDLSTPRRNDQVVASPYSAQPTLPKVQLDRHNSLAPQPLRMNPPTPPLIRDEFPDPDDEDTSFVRQHNGYEPIETGVARTLTVASQGTNASSIYSESAPSLKSNGRPNNGIAKGKYYGDLASATRGIRGMDHSVPGMGGYGIPSPQNSRTPSPEKKKETRVISRSGADIADIGFYGSENPYGLRGRRDVSGKVAEEGRGGSWR